MPGIQGQIGIPPTWGAQDVPVMPIPHLAIQPFLLAHVPHPQGQIRVSLPVGPIGLCHILDIQDADGDPQVPIIIHTHHLHLACVP
jgi:hypothetical protein